MRVARATLVRLVLLVAAPSGEAALAQTTSRTEREFVRLGPGTVVPADDRGALENVGAVGLLRDGASVVADNRSHKLAWFDAAGRLTATTSLSTADGRNVIANQIEFDRRGHAVVLDARNYQLLEAGAERDHGPPKALGMAARAMCLVGDSGIVVAGYDRDALLHEFRRDGRRGKSFGAPLGARGAQAAVVQIGTYLACPVIGARSDERAYVVAHTVSGIVRAFRRDGTELWRYSVPAFRAIDIRSTASGSVSLDKSGGPVDGVSAMALMGPGLLALQVARGSGKEGQLETRFLRVRDGVEVAMSVLVPKLAAVGHGRLAAIETGATPRVRIRRFTIEPGER